MPVRSYFKVMLLIASWVRIGLLLRIESGIGAHSVDPRTRPRTARAITRLVINLKTAKVLASTFLWPTCRGSMRNITGSSTRRFAHGSAAAADIVAHGGVTAVIPITSQRCIGNTKQRVLV